MTMDRSPIFILTFLLLIIGCNSNHRKVTAKDFTDYNAKIDKAEQLVQSQRYDSAFYYLNEAKLSAISLDNSKRIVYALIRMAAVQQIQSDFSGSEVTATESLKYLKDVDEPAYAPVIYNTLGIPVAAGLLVPIFGMKALLSPMMAAAAMSFGSVSVIANALRLLAY